MRILICDDNPMILEQLETYVLEFFASLARIQPELHLFESGDALIRGADKADIAFLDVEMPGVSGIGVARKLKQANPNIKIFIVTSYPDYLDEAMKYEVFRYLSKPIDKNRLFRNLKEAVYQYSIATKEYTILTRNGIATRRSDEIVCIETSQRKVLIYTTDGVLISTEPIEYWRKILVLPCFFVTHRSYIINMQYVYAIEKDKIFLRYSNQIKEAYLARRKYVQFKDTYLLYMESVT